jgi:hypothetical protein
VRLAWSSRPHLPQPPCKVLLPSESETVEPTQPTETKTESEAAVTTAPDITAPEATDAPEQAAPTVEAARKIIMPSALNSQRVRHDITSMGAYTARKVKAALGDEESKLYITAADDFSSAGLGFNPTQYMQSIVSTQGNFGRPAFECVDRQAIPASGMTINRPKFTTYPTTTVEAEGGAVSNTDAVSEYLTSTISKYSGMQTLSIELLERSDPGFYDAITNELKNNYLKVTDAAVVAALTAGGTQATAVAADSNGIISYISTEAPLAYTTLAISLRITYADQASGRYFSAPWIQQTALFIQRGTQ